MALNNYGSLVGIRFVLSRKQFKSRQGAMERMELIQDGCDNFDDFMETTIKEMTVQLETLRVLRAEINRQRQILEEQGHVVKAENGGLPTTFPWAFRTRV